MSQALLPYVARGSGSLPDIAMTSSWQGSQLSFISVQQKRRRLARWSTYAAILVLAGAGLGIGIAQFWNGDGANDGTEANGDRLLAGKKTGKTTSSTERTRHDGAS